MKDIPKTWVLTENSLKISDKKKYLASPNNPMRHTAPKKQQSTKDLVTRKK